MSKEKKNENKNGNEEELKLNVEEENQTEEAPLTDQQSDERIKELEIQASEWQDKFLRKVAEFENYKRRTENDQLNLIKYAAESFVIKLLDVVDDFERSLVHIQDAKDTSTIEEGIKLVYNKLVKTLEEQGVKKIESVGQPFDVNFHEAVMQMQNDSVPPHTVLDEIQSGYVYKDRVIRHSKVIVSDES
ncbi:MAG: nucleotide exchange factor GrpE, partial [Ignavibacteriaceae bacterium]|nr:nucleotide exchange factor GrpE [Ignavibacteriaceae bacterium]